MEGTIDGLFVGKSDEATVGIVESTQEGLFEGGIEGNVMDGVGLGFLVGTVECKAVGDVVGIATG